MGQLKAISVISSGPFEPFLLLDLVSRREVTGKIFPDLKHILTNHVPKVHECPRPFLFTHIAKTIFQTLSLICYTFWPLALLQCMTKVQL